MIGLQSTDEETNRRYLRKALSIYQHADSIVATGRLPLSLQQMALMCNIGHIFSALGKEAKAQRQYQSLLSSMLFVIAGNSNAALDIQDRQFRLFASSILPMLLLAEKGSTAPAA